MTKQEAIRALSAAGYPLVPLKGKKPFEENWETTPHGKHNEKTLEKYVTYGVVLGPRDLVIDVDPRNFKEGDKPLARFMQKIGGSDAVASTFVVRTGGGGLHVYLKKPIDIDVRNALDEFPGIEFKAGVGRQLVGPGSVHPDTGKTYEIAQGDPAKVVAAPAELLNLVKRLPVVLGTGIGEYIDDEATKKRFKEHLQMAPLSVTDQRGDDTAFKVSAIARDYGLSPAVAYDLLQAHWNPRCSPPWSEDDLRAKVAHAYMYARGAVGAAHPAAHFENIEQTPTAAPGDALDAEIGKSGWKLDGKKQPLKCFQNLLNYFGLSQVGLRGVFGYNEFARRVEFLNKCPWGDKTGLPVQDVDLQRMRAHLARQHGYDAGKEDLVDAMVDVAQARRFHPVKDYLSGLMWDGKPRLDTWLIDFCGVMDDSQGYARAVGRKTLCAAVARVYEPGCKFDHVLVLEGTQNIGKSGICKILGGSWFSDFKMNASEKDTVQMMQGKWIVEMAELHAARQTDMDTLKAFLTRQVDEARFAYGRLPGRYPRQGIFIATYNPGPDGTYLKDETGNRRWWPVRTAGMPPGSRHFDFAGLTAARDQIFAEAVFKYKAGEKLTMDTETLQDAAKEVQAERHAEHPWAERVGLWIEERDKNVETGGAKFYTAREVYISAMSGLDARFGRREALDVARAMRDLGWEPGFKKKGGVTLRGYWRPGTKLVTREVLNGTATLKTEIEEKEFAIFGDLV